MADRSASAHAVLRGLRSEHVAMLLCGALVIALTPFTPGFASWGNLGNLLGNLAPLLLVSVGQTLVLICGGIDLSVTSTIALTSVVGALVMNGETGWLKGSPLAAPSGIVIMLALGAAVGLGNGLAVTRLRMPAFIVTLTSMMFLSGLAVWLTQSKPIFGLPPSFTLLGSNLACALPIAIAGVGFVNLLLTRSMFGRWLRAVGYNPRTAEVSGVAVNTVVVSAYVACGALAAGASILYSGRLETGSPVLGQRILLDVIGAAVIGGTSLFGGKGSVFGTVFGVLFLSVLDNALNLLGLSHFTLMMVKGAVILVAAFMDTVRNRWLAA